MENYQNREPEDLLAGLPKEMFETGFDATADLAGEIYHAPLVRTAAVARAAGNASGFEADKHVLPGIGSEVRGTLLYESYTSASGFVYPGHYYVRPAGTVINGVCFHHMANGKVPITNGTLNSVAIRRIGSWHYTIDRIGQIFQWMPEKHATWTTSKYKADISRICIEVENIGGADTGWEISEATFKSAALLLADIALRYPGIKVYHFDGTIDGSNLQRHEWWAATDCPGAYIKKNTARLITAANALIDKYNHPAPDPVPYVVRKDDSGNFRLYIGDDMITAHGEYCDADGEWYHVGSDGFAAVSKDVLIQDTFKGDGIPKWVRYDDKGHMIKGWDARADGIWHFDKTTGAMAKGEQVIKVTFDGVTGRLVE